MIYYARNDHKGILIHCPHCHFGTRYDYGFIEDAIHDKVKIICVVCEQDFEIVLKCKTRAAELANEAESGGAQKGSQRLVEYDSE